jgi:prepilin-type N-terminal cleavage/methylation domain-containing protein
MQKKQHGFTLVELSIVLIIVSLLASGGLVISTSMVNRAAHIDTSKSLDVIKQSLQDFYVVEGRLPCPASISQGTSTANFGLEEVDAVTQKCNNWATEPAGTWRVDGTGGELVRVGMLPVRTLGLPDTAAADKYANRIVYAVTEKLTDSAEFAIAPGAITVVDMYDNNILTNAAYFIGSPGQSRIGAYLIPTGATDFWCDPTRNTLDIENCDLWNPAVFRDAPYNNGDNPLTFFDDQVRWEPKFHLSSRTTTSSTLWAATGDDIYSVGLDDNPATTNVGIGVPNPGERLDVDGTIKASGNLELVNAFIGVGAHGADNLQISTLANKDVLNKFALIQNLSTGNTHLNAYDDGNIYLSNDNQTKMFLRGTDGYLGINTVNPRSAMEIVFDNPILTFGGYSNDLLVTRYENSDDWAPINMLRSRGTQASPQNLQYGDNLGGLLNSIYINGSWWNATQLKSTYWGNGTTHLSDLSLGVNGGSRWVHMPASGKTIMTIPSPEGYNLQDWPAAWAGGLATYDVVAGSIRAWGIDYRSDRRLKKDITPLTQAEVIHKIRQLHPVSFYWNRKDAPANKHFGFIAQEVKPIWPDVVTGEEGDGTYLGMDYAQLIAPLVLTSQKILDRQDAFAHRIDALESGAATQIQKSGGNNKQPAAEQKNMVQFIHSIGLLALLVWVIFLWFQNARLKQEIQSIKSVSNIR